MREHAWALQPSARAFLDKQLFRIDMLSYGNAARSSMAYQLVLSPKP